jgi:hypothetical protein
MDESTENDRHSNKELICKLCSYENRSNINIFLVSHPITEQRHHIQEHHHVVTLQKLNKQDIDKLANNFLRLELGISCDIVGQAMEYISTHAQGVFLCVDLVHKELLDYIEKCGNIEGILRVPKCIPHQGCNVVSRDIHDAVKIFCFVLSTKYED